MKKIEQRVRLCTFILLAFVGGIIFFLTRYAKEADNWYIQSFNKHLYSASGELLQGTMTDRNGLLLSTVRDNIRVYSYRPEIRIATLHTIGDAKNKISTGALNNLRSHLVTYSKKEGAATDTPGNTVILSLDAEACVTAHKALGDAVGCVGVYNYRTGEILVLVSTPSYDPENIPEDLESNEAYQGVYVNRFFHSTFTPGSVFKTITLQAAIEQLPGAAERTYLCEESVKIGDNYVTCTKAHGEQTLKEAFANSCNCAFATLASELGGDVLSAYTRKAGLMNPYRIHGFFNARGSFELASASTYQLGWAGVGLYHDLVNPCSLMIYFGALANEGRAAIPSYLKEVRNPDGQVIYSPEVLLSEELVDGGTARVLKNYLKNNVQSIYGAERFPALSIGAKSGTIEQKTGLSNCWFAGFIDSDEYPYAFVVFMEQAGSGSRVAGTVAADVLKALIPLP
ncbi:MAG: penicillin-binding protein [Lachnospiraceae bacterium]|nr:penicillin-binding protein [Lachnospiraceae bacterium]